MDDVRKDKYFEVVSGVLLGAISGAVSAPIGEAVIKSVISKQLSLPSAKEAAISALFVAPISALLSGYGAYHEFMKKHPQNER